MSAPAFVGPGSVQREETQQSEMIISPKLDIANLAYVLWQQRGCPQGSSEQDWFEAEEMMRTDQQK